MRASDLLARVGIVGSLMLSMLALSAGASAQAHKKPRPSREDRSLATDRIGAGKMRAYFDARNLTSPPVPRAEYPRWHQCLPRTA